MFSQFGAKLAAVATAREQRSRFNFVSRAAVVVAATTVLAGCISESRPVTAAADPADPSVRVSGVGYRSTVAPYTSLRPSTPAPWRERNEGVAPPAKPDR
ncbi:hypothetical protein ACFFWD_12915 [Bradyrhizobium erythrophlei]|uniref:hypothetical protein n=1 Tax=Bradyrhizobium erythrophlei TaxID=1437360 RepID=UPI0035EF1B76